MENSSYWQLRPLLALVLLSKHKKGKYDGEDSIFRRWETVFAKNILGDCLLTPALRDSEFALFDIDLQRLKDSEQMLNAINNNTGNHGKVVAYTDRKAALKDADYVINAVQIGGYKPCTVIDFEVPKNMG